VDTSSKFRCFNVALYSGHIRCYKTAIYAAVQPCMAPHKQIITLLNFSQSTLGHASKQPNFCEVVGNVESSSNQTHKYITIDLPNFVESGANRARVASVIQLLVCRRQGQKRCEIIGHPFPRYGAKSEYC
jgi:hypothetical protein